MLVDSGRFRSSCGNALNILGALLVKLLWSSVDARDDLDENTGGVVSTFPLLKVHLYESPGFGTFPYITLKYRLSHNGLFYALWSIY